MASSGFTMADYEETAEVWPENWPAVEVLLMCQTQWNTGGMGGATGLNYSSLFQILDRRGLTGDEWWRMFDDIRIMESAAITAMRAD